MQVGLRGVRVIISHIAVLLLGTLVGAAMMRLAGGQLRQQKKARLVLKQQQERLEHCHRELAAHFSKNIALLEQLTEEYRGLYQQLLANNQTLLPEQRSYPHNISVDTTNGREPTLIKAEVPCDYSEPASNLLRPKAQKS